jgi:hypothetical protein
VEDDKKTVGRRNGCWVTSSGLCCGRAKRCSDRVLELSKKDASSRIHHNSTLATRKQTEGQQRIANVESAEASAGGGV